MTALSLLIAILLPLARPAAAFEWKDPAAEAKVDALLQKMTLDEKLGQLQQVDAFETGDKPSLSWKLARRGLLGSTLGTGSPKQFNELQRRAMKARLHIPLLFGFDVIHGYRTIFPTPLAEASAFDPSLAQRTAAAAAAEAAAVGLKWTFAPMVDVARDPRWGRVVEGAGEDPLLGSALAAARVRGFQGPDPSALDRVLACAKHWVAYGAVEGGRDYAGVEVSQPTLRDVYFPPFKAALDAGVGTFMSAFNDLNGVPASANPWTLTQVLRGEWNFPGFVVSDYTSVQELIAHGLVADGAQAAQRALSAGVDMEMVSRLYNEHGRELLESGRLTQAQVDEAVRRVLRVKVKLGLFEHPYVDESRAAKELLSPERRALAREAAARSMVLLKNDGVLPLSPDLRSLAVIGPLADDAVSTMGPWNGDGKAADVVTPLAALKKRLAGRVVYARGVPVEGGDDAGLADAVGIARQSEAVLLVLGESSDMSGEASSRVSIGLPGRQRELLEAILALRKPTALVLMNGRPLAIPWEAEHAPAILEAWYPGTEGGPALADVLFGDVAPSGKLPASFPRCSGQLVYYDHRDTGRPPVVEEKWRSKYIDCKPGPVYPFGYGLSYTTFTFSGLSLSAAKVEAGGSVTASVDVRNGGSRAGDEVVQVYLRALSSSVTRPVRQLAGFQRVTLRPGESKRVSFTLGPEVLGFTGRDGRFAVEPGPFVVYAGGDSDAPLQARFEIEGRRP